MVKYEELYEIAKEKLSEKRFNHTLGVVKRAIQYAEIYNENMEKTKIAAILHDIAKEIPKEESYNMLEKYEVKLDDIEKRNFNLIHSILGAEIAKNEYGLDDDIVNAIKYHTTGRENMSMLEKIIYLADATEPNRNYMSNENELSLNELVELIKTNIDEGLEYTLKWNLQSVLRRNLLVHLNTVNAYNFYHLQNS